MEILKVTILNPKAKKLLDDLEDLNLIKIQKPAESKITKRKFGSMKDLVINIADDFDAPLKDFKENM